MLNKKETMDIGGGQQGEVLNKFVFDKEAEYNPVVDGINLAEEEEEFCGNDEKTVNEIKKLDEENQKRKKSRV